LVASYFNSAIYDITGGGSFSAATPFATGTSGVRDLIQLWDGRVMAASQNAGEVDDIHYPAGGAATAFATGLGSVAGLAQKHGGQLFVTSYGSSAIYDITAGGSFSAATAYANGQSFMGLVVDVQDRLFASQLGGTNIFQVTAGAATTFATNAPSGESALGLAAAYQRIVSVTAEPNGANCVAGGTKIAVCFDIDASNSCTAIDAPVSVQYVCDGVGDLVSTTSLAAGNVHCPGGGTEIDSGLDNGDGGGTAGDDILQAGEIDSKQYVCNSVGSLVSTTALTEGNAHCANGGSEIDTGLDNGDGGGTAGDGILQAGEIDTTQYVCNGSNGTNGTNGTDGTNGTNGTDGMNGKDGGCNAGGTGGAASGLLVGFMLVGLTRRSRRRAR
jgi:hypothetical protein